MKMRRLITNFGIATSVAIVVLVFLSNKNTKHYTPRDSNSNGVNGMIEWLKKQRVDFKTGTIDYNYVKQIEAQIQAQRSIKNANASSLTWQEMGPDKVGGRTRAIVVDKNNSQIIYMGSVSGGLWKSTTAAQTWFKVDDYAANLSVTTICQTENGYIYYGTGEEFGTGFIGNGISKSTNGTTFEVLANTANFTYVNQLVAYGNIVYAATKEGLYKTTDDGTTWTKLLTTENVKDVAVASNGNVYAVIAGGIYKSDDGSANSFVVMSGLPTNIWEAQIAVAPSNPNYVYCSIVFSTYDNPFNSSYQDFEIYRTTNAGTDWENISGSYTSSFQPFKSQGYYNNVIKVFPNNENKILLGGIDLYSWDTDFGWQQVSYWVGSQEINSESFYLHADQHEITFDRGFNGTTNQKIYFGNDGGIFISENSAETFISYNLRYNVTQFYNVAAGPTGNWIAGSQDNGTQYNAMEGSNLLRTTEIIGGDGFDCILPTLNKTLKFGSLYFGNIYRITETGDKQELTIQGTGEFNTDFALWESYYDAHSIDSVIYTVEESGINVGEQIIAYSNQGRKPLPYTLTTADLPVGTSETEFPIGTEIKVWDFYQTIFAYASTEGVYASTQAINLANAAINKDKLNDITNATNLVFSKDGNTLFFSKNAVLYKSTNLLVARYINVNGVTIIDKNLVETQAIGTFPGYITSIAPDPEVSNNIIVTLGGYSSTPHIYYSTNAAGTVSTNLADNFIDVTGDLVGIPVYSSIIVWNDSRKVVLGTEYGVYLSNDITNSTVNWVVQTDGFPNVAVFDLFQQTVKNEWENGVINHGYIYAATFGRGVFLSKSNAGPVSVKDLNSAKNNNLSDLIIYPNPAIDYTNLKFTLNKTSKLVVNIYNINGQNVYNKTYNGNLGDNNIRIATSNLQSGTYFVKVISSDSNKVVKMIVK